MNDANMEWFKSIPYVEGSMLEVGSFNVNGSLRTVLPITLGIDIREGRGVDVVMDACDLDKTYGTCSFDNVVSCCALEHCRDVVGVIRNIFSVCKTGGIIAVSAASVGKGRHPEPDDFWRFDINTLEHVFRGHEVISKFHDRITEGIAVRKTAKKLDMPVFDLRLLPAKKGVV